jgi:hypothetical protein
MLAERFVVINALFDGSVKAEMARVLEIALEDLEPGRPLRDLFTAKLSFLPEQKNKLQVLQQESDGTKNEEIDEMETRIKDMESDEQAHFEDMQTHIQNALLSLPLYYYTLL